MNLVTWVIYPAFEPQVGCNPQKVLLRLAQLLVSVELVDGRLTLTGPEKVLASESLRKDIRARHDKLVATLLHSGGEDGQKT